MFGLIWPCGFQENIEIYKANKNYEWVPGCCMTAKDHISFGQESLKCLQ
jgi:methionine synthase I (cobalamin-dependent)